MLPKIENHMYTFLYKDESTFIPIIFIRIGLLIGN
jgi:hypothetical protein